MELGSALHQTLDNLAQSLGFNTGQYTITVVKQHEFLYRGVETLVTITGPKGRHVHLKIKQRSTMTNEIRIPWENCFFNNVHYYTTVLPILKTYGNVPMCPKYYGSSLKKGEEYLILEDLEKSENYKRMEPYPGLGLAHVREAIKMLAYFHCTVQLWKSKNPPQFKSVCGKFKPFLGNKYPFKEDYGKCEKMIKEIFTGIWKMMMQNESEYREALQKVLSNIKKLGAQALKDGSEVEDQPWTTLNNCFTYTTNIFFKCHSVSGAVIDVGLEDWSATRLGSPALDLSLLLFSTTSADILAGTTALMNEYFTEHLSITELKEKHMTRFGVFGVFGGVFINVAKAIEDKFDMRLELVTAQVLSAASFTSSTVPDLKARLIAVVKAAVENKIL